MSQSQELGLRAQVLDVVPPGPIHRNRRSAVARFSHRIPNFRDPGSAFSLVPDPRAGAMVDLAARKKEETVSRLRPSSHQQQQQRGGPEIKVPLLLEQRDAASNGSGAPSAVYKGVPEAGGGNNMDGPPLHYVFFRSGNRVTAFPAEQWFAFKPHVDRRGLLDSVTAANAAAATAAAGRQPPFGSGFKDLKGPFDPFALRMVPKSQRLEKQRQEEEARERQEQVAAGRLLPMAGAMDDELGRGFGGGGLRRFVDEDDLEAELFGGEEEDEAPRFGGKGGKGGKKGGRGRGPKTADDEELEEDEVPEDLYGGPGSDDKLRPEKPEEAEDWEHEFAPDDDDQDQGQDDVYDDDPGMRKKLGIEADDEDEGEEADEQARKLKKLGDPDDSDEEEEQKKKEEDEEAKKQQAAAAAQEAAAAGGEEDEQDEEDEDELDELDEMEDEPKPPPPRPPPVPPPATKPPPAPGPAVAAGAKRKVPEESRPAAEGAKRARTATPPPAVTAAAAAARPATPAAAAGGAPAAGAAAAAQQQQRPAGAAGAAPGAAAGSGPAVTVEEVVELLRKAPNGIMPFQEFTRFFAKRTTTPELRAGLKSLTVSLCKSSKNEAGQLLVSLKK